MQPYPNPPIKEALIDIRSESASEISLDILASYQDAIKERFPIREERLNWESGLQFKPGSAPEIISPSVGAYGYFFRSEKEKKIVQARRDGFTFNKLKPYDRWEVFSSEGKELWESYVQIVKPSRVTRLALRYINRIEIPLPIRDFKDYVLTTPEIAPGIPQGMANFFMQVVIPEEDVKVVAIITVTTEPKAIQNDTFPYVFDIDVYRLVSLQPSDPKIWEIMEDLRNYKNLIFKSSVTSKCEDLFK